MGTDLSALTDGLGWLFARPEPKETFGLFVRAMLADVAKKNCWTLAEYAGLVNLKRFQHLLNKASWDADVLRDWLRGYSLAGLADVDGVLVLDDTQAIKKGAKSVVDRRSPPLRYTAGKHHARPTSTRFESVSLLKDVRRRFLAYSSSTR